MIASKSGSLDNGDDDTGEIVRISQAAYQSVTRDKGPLERLRQRALYTDLSWERMVVVSPEAVGEAEYRPLEATVKTTLEVLRVFRDRGWADVLAEVRTIMTDQGEPARAEQGGSDSGG